jgi:hypothetical protein
VWKSSPQGKIRLESFGAELSVASVSQDLEWF